MVISTGDRYPLKPRTGFMFGDRLPASINTKSEKERKEESEILQELKSRIDNWDDVFASLMCRFMENQDIYAGTGHISRNLNTKNCVFNPAIKAAVDEIVAYLKTNPRSITINIDNQKQTQDVVNEIIGKLMNDNNIYNRVLKSFIDYLIYGVSFLKIDSDNERIVNVTNVNIKNCRWDINSEYDDFKPSFFIHEYIENNFDASNKYGHIATEHNREENYMRLNINRKEILEAINTVVNNQPTIEVQYNEDIYDNVKTVVSKTRVNDGISQILEYYILENFTDENTKTSKKHYMKYTFVNDRLYEKVKLDYDAFPFISLAKYNHDADFSNELFDSKIHDLKSEIIHLNMIENSIIDAIACNANGLMIVKKSAFQDKEVQGVDLKSSILALDESGDGRLSDSIINLPPVSVSPVMADLVNQIQSKIKVKFGLINFDPNMAQSKSGYHESLRLDRESQSISNLVSPIDNALTMLAKKLYSCIREYSEKSLDKISSLSENLDAYSILKDFSKRESDKINSINVSESRESPNNTMKTFNQIQMIADISGQPLNIPVEMIADMLNVSESTKEIIRTMNSSEEDPAQKAEIRDKNASAASKEADALKKTVEAEKISRGG